MNFKLVTILNIIKQRLELIKKKLKDTIEL